MINVDIVVASDRYFENGQAQADLESIANNTIIEAIGDGHRTIFSMLKKRPAGVYLSDSETPHPSRGYYSSQINHMMVNSMHGRIDDGGVIYGPWLEGISERNATTRFKGYSVFRRVAQLISAAIPDVWARNAARFGWR